MGTTTLPVNFKEQVMDVISSAGIAAENIDWMNVGISPCTILYSDGVKRTPFYSIQYFHRMNDVPVMGNVAHISMFYQDGEFVYGDIIMPKFEKTETISEKDAINSAFGGILNGVDELADVGLTYAKDENDNLSVAARVIENGEFQVMPLQ